MGVMTPSGALDWITDFVRLLMVQLFQGGVAAAALVGGCVAVLYALMLAVMLPAIVIVKGAVAFDRLSTWLAKKKHQPVRPKEPTP